MNVRRGGIHPGFATLIAVVVVVGGVVLFQSNQRTSEADTEPVAADVTTVQADETAVTAIQPVAEEEVTPIVESTSNVTAQEALVPDATEEVVTEPETTEVEIDGGPAAPAPPVAAETTEPEPVAAATETTEETASEQKASE